MGQEQSNNNNNNTNSPTSSSYGSGVSNSFSFLAKKRDSTKTSQIVVVNANGQTLGDPNDDDDYKRIKEVPRFFPILKGVLPAFRDSPEVFTKIEPKYIFRFLQRLQQHFYICSQKVDSEQSILFTQIVEMDRLTALLLKKTINSTKKFDYLTMELKKVEQISFQMDTIQRLLEEIIPSIETLNEILPISERLLPLQLHEIPFSTRSNREAKKNDVNISLKKIQPAQEYTVVDKET